MKCPFQRQCTGLKLIPTNGAELQSSRQRTVDGTPAFHQLLRTVYLCLQGNLVFGYHFHFLKAECDTGSKVLIHGKFCDSLSKSNLMGVSRLVTHINHTGPEKIHYSQRSYSDKSLHRGTCWMQLVFI